MLSVCHKRRFSRSKMEFIDTRSRWTYSIRIGNLTLNPLAFTGISYDFAFLTLKKHASICESVANERACVCMRASICMQQIWSIRDILRWLSVTVFIGTHREQRQDKNRSNEWHCAMHTLDLMVFLLLLPSITLSRPLARSLPHSYSLQSH